MHAPITNLSPYDRSALVSRSTDVSSSSISSPARVCLWPALFMSFLWYWALNWVASLGLLGLRKIPLQARGLKVLECNPRRDCRTKKRANTQKSSIRLIDIDNWWQSIGGSGCALKLMETFRTGATLWQQTLNSSCHSAA